MMVSEMLKYGYQPKNRLGPKSNEQALIPDQVDIDDIVEKICNLFVAMAREEEGINLNKLTIRDTKPGEILQNWTISPSLFHPESW
ncbi:hypothetical protein H5410_028169 [Solanum commersonii]|uniref:Uncharacterized protein n=1 Tax=Solanum commersonii TaxID=4109 RepID=A0A9J5Z3A5_SOLCO|nr:hypothetical protein H5410_028169 [Solanum commersonii]